MTPDERVGWRAARQHGLSTRGEALDLGMTPKQVRRRLATGRWLTLRREVYAIAGVPASFEQNVLAAVLASRGRATASHATAGALWRMPGIEAERIELLVPLGRRLELDGVLCHRTVDLPRRRPDPAPWHPCHDAARTLVDLSGRLRPTELGTICDNLLRRRQLRLADLRRCARRLEGASGRQPTVVHEVLAARLPGYEPGDSDLETTVVRVLLAAGLPCPVLGLRVRAAGRTYRIDLAYPQARLAIELDGWDTHRSRSAFQADRAKGNDLVLLGWRLLRFTATSTDAEIVASVRAALAASGNPMAG